MHHPRVTSMHCCHHRDLFDSSRCFFNENEQKTTAEDFIQNPPPVVNSFDIENWKLRVP
eukprot:jgi/Bigna1/64605/fgenesh1_kg.80_\